jgi:Zn-dependent protease/predicted  nucleic acid-binding Zn-ribbon protein
VAEAAPAPEWSSPHGCTRCGTEVGDALLACPSCNALLYADELKRIAADAQRAEDASDRPRAVALWRQALDLLPPSSKQYGAIVERVGTLTETADSESRRNEEERVRAKFGKHGAIVGAIAVFLLKFKFLIVLLLTKGKLLLLGLTKLGTLSSMLLFLGFDASLFGWQLALGIVLSIYVHEMGHVAALHRHGIKASSPMFLPGLGAFIRAQQRIHGEWPEADVGLAGPLWGLGAAIAAYAGYHFTGNAYWATVARWGALINLFNLLPVWQLDGAHAFKAMSRQHRVTAALTLLAAALLTHEGMLWLPFLGASWAVFQRPATRADVRALGYYVILVGALSLVVALCRGAN